jgi:hypothetical protein
VTVRAVRDDDDPASGHYEVRDHSDMRGLVTVYWHPDDGGSPTPILTIGPGRIPPLAAALAEWELANQIPAQTGRAVSDDGAV